MTITAVDTMIDRFVRVLETAEDPDGVLHPDVFADFNVPHWRYQMQGAETLLRQLKDDCPFGATVTTGQRLTTPVGFVLETHYVFNGHDSERLESRNSWLVKVQDRVVSEIVLYCTGDWDEATQARQAAEAPMIRP